MLVKSLLNERHLPDLLAGAKSSEDFKKRQDEIRELLLKKQYGVIPPRPDHMWVEVVSENAVFCAGKATLSELVLHFELNGDEFSFPIIAGIPKSRERVPAFVNIRFNFKEKYLPLEEICENGFAVFAFYYTDVTSDDGNFKDKCARHLLKSRRGASACGKLSMWAWAAMRVMDYVMTLDEIDTDNVAVVGHSRLGKTALLAGGVDDRFKYVISNDSGCAGAAIERGKIGESYKQIAHVFPHWFCPSFVQDAAEEKEMPFDQHFLLSLSAPRVLVIGSAENDLWADPRSEFLGAASVSEAYELFGERGLVHNGDVPTATTLLCDGSVCYFIRQGEHYFSREDWHAYMQIIKKKMK